MGAITRHPRAATSIQFSAPVPTFLPLFCAEHCQVLPSLWDRNRRVLRSVSDPKTFMPGVILKVKGRLLGRGIWQSLPLGHAWLGKISVVENGCSVCLCGAGKGSSLASPATGFLYLRCALLPGWPGWPLEGCQGNHWPAPEMERRRVGDSGCLLSHTATPPQHRERIIETLYPWGEHRPDGPG